MGRGKAHDPVAGRRARRADVDLTRIGVHPTGVGYTARHSSPPEGADPARKCLGPFTPTPRKISRKNARAVGPEKQAELICAATTAAGSRCKLPAMPGSDLCVAHLRRCGRKTKLTPELTDRLVSLLRGGVPLGTAIAAVNLPKSTFYAWMASGRPAHARFVERVREAQAFGEAALVSRIATASAESWQAAAWLLERQWPERYARLSQRPQAPADQQDDPFAEFVTDELAARRDHHHRGDA